ncbi:hypothetical protein NFI96_008493, partial [Prochilodus magdalenae]
MMFLCSLSLFIIMIESCVSQSISPLEEKVDAVGGQTVTLSCSYEGGAIPNSLQWYRQHPGSRPEYLLMVLPVSKRVNYATPRFPRLDGAVNGSVVELEISSAAVSDSVLYYCALEPTVTGNPDTLYRNSPQENTSAVILESCVSQSISPLEEKVHAVEGETVILSCKYDGGGNDPYLHWYREYPGSRPEFLLLTQESFAYFNKAENLDARMSIKVHKEEKKKVDLEISSAAVSDSVLYYCALQPTVTGNPDT